MIPPSDKVTQIQLELLKSFRYISDEKQLNEVKSLLAFYLRQKLDDAIVHAKVIHVVPKVVPQSFQFLLTFKIKNPIATVKIILRTSKTNSVGEAPLAIRITKDRISKFIFLNYRIKPEFWDDENKRVKKSHPNSQRLNNYIATKMKEGQEAALLMETSDKNILTDKIKEQIMGKAPESFFTYADKYVAELRANKKLGSHRKTKTVVSKLRKYTGGRELFFEHITVTWLKE